MQFTTLAAFIPAIAAVAATAQDPTVVLTTYRTNECNDTYSTDPSSTLASPPINTCVDLPPQSLAFRYRVMAGEIKQGCTLQVWGIFGCGTKSEGYSEFPIESGHLTCEATPFTPNNDIQARSVIVSCPQ